MADQDKKDTSIARGAGTISGLTMVSRILGLFREALMASLFRLSWVMDAFVFAYQLPNLFRKLFGEGALSAALIPVYTEYIEHHPREEANRLFSTVFSLMTLLLTGITVLGILSSFTFPFLFGNGGEIDRWLLLFSQLFRWLFPYLILICLVALLGGVLQVHRHFTTPALAPVAMNVVLVSVLGILFYYHGGAPDHPDATIFWVAGAVLVGGVVQFLIQIPPLIGYNVKFSLHFDWSHPGIRKIFGLLGPAAVGLAVVQFNLVMDSVIAKMLVPEDGAISALWFGNRLMQVPLGLIGVALSTAAFPFLSEEASKGNVTSVTAVLEDTLMMTLFLAIPASVGLALLDSVGVELLFEYGSFQDADTTRTAGVLFYYSLGVWLFCMYNVLTKVFYSLEDTITPAFTAAGMVIINLGLNIFLVLLWESETGIALGTSITSFLNVLVLGGIFKYRYPSLRLKRILASVLRCALFAGIMGLGVYLTLITLQQHVLAPDMLPMVRRLVQVIVPGASGVLLYLGLAFIVRMPEFRVFRNQIIMRETSDSSNGKKE